MPITAVPLVETDRAALVSPVIDYEPPPIGRGGPACAEPAPAALHRHTPRSLAPRARPQRESPAPRAAAVFADTALRRVLEVVDRRRPTAQLRNMLPPNLIDTVGVLARTPSPEGAAVLTRVRLRAQDARAEESAAAEVFATYTRGKRVRAIAGRVEVVSGRWQLVALQIG